ncbi:FAD dependent oxidoreductase [Candidatus Koribacter versatilis Ellin345]|uniref:FAD dependent oxidoreductase n=1 Tax=Koribacter versatilis (strain Ellin345) TaxID=204669 RepID=Q1ILY6_KORVE|nr:FAD-binding oxidoreductase [Candidatus Koribacter versatilis]ABF42114.1 FAD dependent oxidoreductase [Candidatus Koribacter versatilis Ellin345]
MNYTERNFWLDTVEMPRGSDVPVPERADVAVIGAGFTGLSAARTLAKLGARVVVLEAETVGWGASSRNGGMVLTGMKLSNEVLQKRYGFEATKRMYDASLASIDYVEQVVKEDQIECDFSRCGHLEVANKQSHFDAYARVAEMTARDFGHTLHIIPKSALKSEIGAEMYFGGMVDEDSAGVNPARYVAGLGLAALKAGACVFERARVQSIDRVGSGFRLTTSKGTIEAKDVLIATSGYTGKLSRPLLKRVIPIGSFIIATEKIDAALANELIPHNRMVYDSLNFLHYWRRTPDDRILFGGRAAFFPETSNTIRKSEEILQRDLVAIHPQLKNTKVEYAWGGTLDFTFDVMPHAGEFDGVHYALGYAGHGVAMATYLGMLMAEKLAGKADRNPFAGIPFPGAPLGLYNGQPWFLPFAAAYYKVLDFIS